MRRVPHAPLTTRNPSVGDQLEPLAVDVQDLDPTVGLEVFPELGDVHVHAPAIEIIRIAPDGIERILTAGIPVMGHLGLTPQSIYKFGTYSVRAKEEAEAAKLKQDALALQEAGCFGIVLEKVPAPLAKEVAEILSIPVIGIGAGAGVDGQVLVFHDLVGMTHQFNPRFLRRYLNLYEDITTAIGSYVKDVKDSDFPNESESYTS